MIVPASPTPTGVEHMEDWLEFDDIAVL